MPKNITATIGVKDMRGVRRILILSGLAIACSGCASTRYSGPGDVQDFAAARTQCYSILKSTADNEPTVNCGAWTACLTSKGYVLDRDGQFDVDDLGMRVSCTD